ncbi:GPO family capsid scaffolding protein [Rhodothalassium salexigens]|uniref:GPO family capsid scaffolding protein n=1 Tax=Rhodothalassium salexigens TaxID=1086 RepID=UPI001911E3E1|nr:GPO family capsid scaffolding protein [Rhodothalassium salexigens]
MKTKFYRVCRSGPTIDGRTITPDQIDQMAETYDPDTYGARVWVEHLRSLLPNDDAPFKAYGDVLALKAEPDQDGHRVLLAQIDATEDLVKLNARRQKVYWSVEIDPDFAASGKAYLCGLALTDTPASLGTEIIKLSLTHRAELNQTPPERLYSVPVDAPMEAAAPEPPAPTPTPSADPATAGPDADRLARIEATLTTLAASLAGRQTAPTAQPPAPTATPETTPQTPPTDAPVSQAQFAALVQLLASQPATAPRSPHAGTALTATDC